MIILENIGKRMNSLLFSEKEKLFWHIKNFLNSAEHEILIISPYIQTAVLKSLLQSHNVKISIITTWKLQDLQTGISELELFDYCKLKNNMYLYLNPRIHLKAFIKDYSACIFGSSNISEKGLALSSNYNYELNGEVETLNVDSIIYFKKILQHSVLVNEKIVEQYREALAKIPPLPTYSEPNIYLIPKKTEFLISSLPMSSSINELYTLYSNHYQGYSKEARECAIHDVILYNIPDNLSYPEFRRILKERFFSSPFIQKLLDYVSEEGRYFGEVKTWIQQNCEDVPVPSRRDLTGIIQILYRWIVDLSDGEFTVDRPHHSERLYKVKS